MANQSPYDNRDIVEKYLYHKLLKRGYVWEFRAGAEEDDGLTEPPAEVVDRRPRALLPLHRVLREAGDEIERTYQRDFAAMSDQLHFTPSTAQRRFTAVIEELFRDGVNWGRIVVFFEFGSTLCVESVNQEMASQVDNIASWMTDYLNGPLQNWIRENGGWFDSNRCKQGCEGRLNMMLTGNASFSRGQVWGWPLPVPTRLRTSAQSNVHKDMDEDLDWPAQNPDLNLIKHLWDEGQDSVQASQVHVLMDLALCTELGSHFDVEAKESAVLQKTHRPCSGIESSLVHGMRQEVGGEVLPQVEEFKYLGVLFTSEGRMDREIDKRIGAAAAVMRSMYRSVVVKKELSRKAKLSIYQSIYAPTLTYGHELWVMTERVRSQIQAAEMSFLRRVAGRSLRDRVRSSVTREELGVEPLLLRIERGQLRWLGHPFRMPPGRLPGEVFRACPIGKRPRGRPRTRWRDYVFRLAWERLGVPPEELEEVAREREDAFVELYSHQRASIFHPWPYLKTVFGLAALGAAGVTIGALFSQK
ncbi:hypothetical protein QTP86_033092 [Hemibagrus guttatus]|nr:hypothetical protein QTP86_033092 [Hemibagrus guttatus]